MLEIKYRISCPPKLTTQEKGRKDCPEMRLQQGMNYEVHLHPQLLWASLYVTHLSLS